MVSCNNGRLTKLYESLYIDSKQVTVPTDRLKLIRFSTDSPSAAATTSPSLVLGASSDHLKETSPRALTDSDVATRLLANITAFNPFSSLLVDLKIAEEVP
ncbi:hypothetical protein NPIL_405641 [Nephila pilipes]|uniref:Uncharacterized protein n=1 Tax=Nephila pilipes TaxID=299642 RepID=A0A8X6TVD9_NEPPI|nr:hypothetical protein NPIL_405641 [Nephila pilipes]